ncbi:MAG: tRNA uridine(34) 5-carboxymethylaminomethyl modification radical SAM/GNAT enzyme Elp3 [Chloroflexi bacterium]|nr:tRNA uridine(34) 5-carboxymethylaminomethyl modification radical SAM/GNAT enzyme Elp3 [Chloroflexota bacterium]
MSRHPRTPLDLESHRAPLTAIVRAALAAPEPLTALQMNALVRKHPMPGGNLFKRSDLIAAFRQWAGQDGLPPYTDDALLRLQLKPVRTSSGVTPVTVLTKPFPCPGTCIFCPNDIRMPKSYLSDEPGAQRAEQNAFDPYLQTMSRLTQYDQIGHPTDKIEVIVLGGTWSFYPETYQIWFIKRIFDALHDFGNNIDRSDHVRALLAEQSQFHPDRNTSNVTLYGIDLAQSYNQTVQAVYKDEMTRSREVSGALLSGQRTRTATDEYATWDELEAAHAFNETAPCRCVGLVVETRPDHIDAAEVLRIRRLGCTKVQIGFQSLNDHVLRVNKRGHDVAATRRAVNLLRRAGFKIHAHWMPNLYGSTPDADIDDYRRMFADPDFCPDELKVYPCSLIESAELMQVYQRGDWQPYTHDELLHVLSVCFMLTPEYCRLTRVIRDIPGTDIVDGNKLTNFRQVVEQHLAASQQRSPDIRARETRFNPVQSGELALDDLAYPTSAGEERFLQYITPGREIAGFLRLALLDRETPPLTPELDGAAIVREVHVYGQALGIGENVTGRAQHSGLGTALLERAADIARERGCTSLAVISAVGTRAYYRKRGFIDAGLYQVRPLD